jgi:uncharacterized RDD family membrane protein YckC
MDKLKLQQLIEELKSGNDRQRRAASYKLGKSKDQDAVPALIIAYNDKDSSVRQNAVEGLKIIRSKEAVEFLVSHDIEKVALITEQPIQATLQAAPNSRRFINLAVDTIIYEVISFFVMYPLAKLAFGESVGTNFWISWLFGLSTLFLYYFIFEMAFQRTPGKFLTGTRVVLEDGSRPDAATIAKRALCRFVPFEVLSQYTGKDPNQMGTWWHDRWTNTRVIQS